MELLLVVHVAQRISALFETTVRKDVHLIRAIILLHVRDFICYLIHRSKKSKVVAS